MRPERRSRELPTRGCLSHDRCPRTPVAHFGRSQGSPLLETVGESGLSTLELRGLIDVGRERTLYQDPSYGIRQLVDIAVQALYPAVNAPTTAVQVLDRLVDLVGRIGQAPSPTGLTVDQDGQLRLVQPVPSWADVVDPAFTEIRTYGAGSPQVTKRLTSAFNEILAVLPSGREEPIHAHRTALMRAVEAAIPDPAARAVALRPDPRGLG